MKWNGVYEADGRYMMVIVYKIILKHYRLEERVFMSPPFGWVYRSSCLWTLRNHKLLQSQDRLVQSTNHPGNPGLQYELHGPSR